VSPSEKTDARDPSGGAGRPTSTGTPAGAAPTASGGAAGSSPRPAGQRPAGAAPRPAAGAGGSGTLGNGPRPATGGPAQRGTTARPLTPPPAATSPAGSTASTTARPAPAAAGAAASSAATAPTAVRPARTGSDARPAEQPEAAHAASSPPGEAPRRVKLSLSRVSLWSVARLAFLLSVALGIIAVVAVTVLWAVLNGMGVFSQLDSVISDVVGSESNFRVADLLSLSRVLSVTVFLAVVDVVLLTLISTIAAVLYNLASGLVGGVRLTLSDD
jgi:hypothetical protein